MAVNQLSTVELLQAVRELLSAEVQPVLADDSLKFKLRIALNVIKIVERELQLGPQFEQQASTDLQQLLCCDHGSEQELSAQLCQRIQQGEFDGDNRALLTLLTQGTLHKLAIDNPRYSTYLKMAPTPD